MPFEAFLQQKQAKPTKGRRLTIGVSLGAHGALAIAAVVHSFWHTDELSPPTVTVTFLAALPPPPPPPPPPKKKSTPTKTVTKDIVQPKPNELLQPKAKEEQPKEEEGDENGEVDGVAGGVVGGVVGGVGIGTPPPAPPPPPSPPPPLPKEQASFLSPSVAVQQLLTDPRLDKQYRVTLPPALQQAGMRLWAMLKVCVNTEGGVSDVKIIKGMDPSVDPLLLAKVQTWRYKPWTRDGRPSPFCYNVRYETETR
jgi:protein TonB